MRLQPRRLLRHLTSDVAVTTGSRCGSQAISLVAIVFAGRYLSLAQFGAFAIGWIAVVVATTFIYTGLYEYLLLAREEERERDTVFWMMVLLGVGCVAVIAGIGLACGGTARPTGLILLCFAPLPLIAVPAAWSEALLLRAGRLRRVAIGTLLPEMIGLLALIAGLLWGSGWYALIVWRLVTGFTSVATLLALGRLRPRRGWCEETRRSALGVAVPLYGSALTQMASNYGADVVLALMLSPAAVGAYRAGSRFVSAVSDMLYRPVRTLGWARMSRSARDGDLSALGTIWRESTGFLAAIAWPVLAVLAVIGPDLIVTFINPAWRDAGPVLRMLALAGMAQALDLLLEPALSCLGERRTLSAIRLGSVVLLILSLLLAAPFGATAAAGAVVMVRLIVAAAAVLALTRRLDLSAATLMKPLRAGILVTAACAMAAAMPLLFCHAMMARILVTGLAAFAVWAGLTMPLLLSRRIVLPST